ncbi:MAG: hypothetical protein A2X80_09185 [Geobacteraceae bacterium GWB2_52_12]|nr:MAG: hypothetical protein A2X80_09185 [Geobacteraceae bacterium GWB2_52_12]
MKALSQFFVLLLFIIGITGCGGSDSASKAEPIYDKPAVAAETVPSGQMGGSIQNTPLPDNLNTTTVTILAGGAITPGTTRTAGFLNYTGTKAQFNRPISITTNKLAIYAADYNNHVIRKISLPDLKVETFAGSGVAGFADGVETAARFYYPSAITMDSTNLYVTDSRNFAVRKIDLATRTVTTIAGSSEAAGSIDSTVGTDARFNELHGITTDGNNIFVSDSNNTIRWIVKNPDETYKVTTLAGTPDKVGSADGTAEKARFNLPGQLTTDGTYLYVTDFNNHTVRRINILTAAVDTIAGTKGVSGASDIAPGTFYQPNGITTDGTYLYVTDSYRNTIRRMNKNGENITTLAGSITGIAGLTTNTAGTAALFDTPIGLTTDGISLFVADSRNNIIRRIEP